VHRRLAAGPRRVDLLALAVDNAVVDAVLDIGRRVRRAQEALAVGLVLGEQNGGLALAIEKVFAQLAMGGRENLAVLTGPEGE